MFSFALSARSFYQRIIALLRVSGTAGSAVRASERGVHHADESNVKHAGDQGEEPAHFEQGLDVVAARAGLEELTIGLPPYLSSCCSAEMIGELTALFPDTRFSVMEGSWEGLLDALRANEIQLVYTSGPLELPGVKVHTFGRGELVILLRRGSPLSAQIQEENGVGFLDPRLLQGEPLALTKPGQATRRLAEGLLREAEIPVNTVQESRHIETLYRYAQKGIATAIVPLMADMEDRDRENGLICRIPKSYRAAAICGCIAVLPELDRLIPREVYSVIRGNVFNNTSYLLLN